MLLPIVSNIAKTGASTSRGMPHPGTNAHVVGTERSSSVDYSEKQMPCANSAATAEGVILPLHKNMKKCHSQ